MIGRVSPGLVTILAVALSSTVLFAIISVYAQFESPVALTDPNPEISGELGHSVSSGDVNNDGYDDIIVGDPQKDADLTINGAVFVFLGPNLTSVTELHDPELGSGDRFGLAVASGDVNGDGYDDVIAGSGLAAIDELPDV